MGGDVIFIGFCLLLLGLAVGANVIETVKSVVGLFIHDITYFFATLGFLEAEKADAWPNCMSSDEAFFAGATPWNKFLRSKYLDAICAADMDIDQPLLARKTIIFSKILILAFLIFLVVDYVQKIIERWVKSFMDSMHLSNNSNPPSVPETGTVQPETEIVEEEIETFRSLNDGLTATNTDLEVQVSNLSRENTRPIKCFEANTTKMAGIENTQTSQHDKVLEAEEYRRGELEFVIQRNDERHQKGLQLHQQNFVVERGMKNLTEQNNNIIMEKKNLTMEKDNLIAEKGGWTAEKSSLIMAMDKLATEKEALIAKIQAEFDKQLNQATEKHKELADLMAKELEKKDNQIAERDRQLAEKDEQISERNNQLAEKDKETAEGKKQLAEKDKRIVELDAQRKKEFSNALAETKKLTQEVADASQQVNAESDYEIRQLSKFIAKYKGGGNEDMDGVISDDEDEPKIVSAGKY